MRGGHSQQVGGALSSLTDVGLPVEALEEEVLPLALVIGRVARLHPDTPQQQSRNTYRRL